MRSKIKNGLSDFNLKLYQSEQAANAMSILYDCVFEEILRLKVLLSGNELSETIELLIEVNQQVTLDLNEADQDTTQGVQIEETLDGFVNDLEERQE